MVALEVGKRGMMAERRDNEGGEFGASLVELFLGLVYSASDSALHRIAPMEVVLLG